MASKRSRTSKKPAPQRAAASPRRGGLARMPFERRNYVLLLGALALIVGGYVLMMIDNAVSDNPVDSPISLYLASLMLLVGYLGVLAAILTGFRDRAAQAEAEAPAVPEPEAA